MKTWLQGGILFPESASKESKVTTNQSLKNLNHIVLSKKAFAICDQVLDKAEKKASEGEETPPCFSWGACCDYSVGWSLKPCRQTPPFCGFWADWRSGETQRERGQTQLCASGGQVLSGIGQLLLYSWPPPPPPSLPSLPSAHAHKPHAHSTV